MTKAAAEPDRGRPAAKQGEDDMGQNPERGVHGVNVTKTAGSVEGLTRPGQP
jgi:hypothetical protein